MIPGLMAPQDSLDPLAAFKIPSTFPFGRASLAFLVATATMVLRGELEERAALALAILCCLTMRITAPPATVGKAEREATRMPRASRAAPVVRAALAAVSVVTEERVVMAASLKNCWAAQEVREERPAVALAATAGTAV
jgi:hypothetical protein